MSSKSSIISTDKASWPHFYYLAEERETLGGKATFLEGDRIFRYKLLS